MKKLKILLMINLMIVLGVQTSDNWHDRNNEVETSSSSSKFHDSGDFINLKKRSISISSLTDMSETSVSSTFTKKTCSGLDILSIAAGHLPRRASLQPVTQQEPIVIKQQGTGLWIGQNGVIYDRYATQISKPIDGMNKLELQCTMAACNQDLLENPEFIQKNAALCAALIRAYDKTLG